MAKDLGHKHSICHGGDGFGLVVEYGIRRIKRNNNHDMLESMLN